MNNSKFNKFIKNKKNVTNGFSLCSFCALIISEPEPLQLLMVVTNQYLFFLEYFYIVLTHKIIPILFQDDLHDRSKSKPYTVLNSTGWKKQNKTPIAIFIEWFVFSFAFLLNHDSIINIIAPEYFIFMTFLKGMCHNRYYIEVTSAKRCNCIFKFINTVYH